MADEPDGLPPWVTWQQRPFPDANLILLPGRNPALAGSGFAGHVGQTAELSARPHRPAAAGHHHPLARRPRRRQRDTAGQGCGITGSVADADAVARRDPHCCQAEYLDQPVIRKPSMSSSTIARSCRSVTLSGRSSALPGTLRATCACGGPTSGSSSSAMPCPTTSAGSTPHWTDLMPPRPHSHAGNCA